MNNYTFMEWNINQATNMSGENLISVIVPETVTKVDPVPDLICLVEYSRSCKNSDDFIALLDQNGYGVCMTDNGDGMNDVLLAWRRSLFTASDAAESEDLEMLSVKLTDRTGYSFMFAGCRMRLGDYNCNEGTWKKRRMQFARILNSLNDRSTDLPLLLLGDFNNNRTNLNFLSKDKKKNAFINLWSVKVVDRMAEEYGLKRYTPSQPSSIKAVESIFQEDHLICKGFSVRDINYDRSFTKSYPDIYINGEDFEVYDRIRRESLWSIPFGSGIPDHAILSGTVGI